MTECNEMLEELNILVGTCHIMLLVHTGYDISPLQRAATVDVNVFLMFLHNRMYESLPDITFQAVVVSCTSNIRSHTDPILCCPAYITINVPERSVL